MCVAATFDLNLGAMDTHNPSLRWHRVEPCDSEWETILPDTNTTAPNDEKLFKTGVELEAIRAFLMTTADADRLARILSDDLYYAH